jgi:hypothetical protein
MDVDTAEVLGTLAIGDRVILRDSKSSDYGTVTQVLDDGVVRVLWDAEKGCPLQFGEVLIKMLPERRRAAR